MPDLRDYMRMLPGGELVAAPRPRPFYQRPVSAGQPAVREAVAPEGGYWTREEGRVGLRGPLSAAPNAAEQARLDSRRRHRDVVNITREQRDAAFDPREEQGTPDYAAEAAKESERMRAEAEEARRRYDEFMSYPSDEGQGVREDQRRQFLTKR